MPPSPIYCVQKKTKNKIAAPMQVFLGIEKLRGVERRRRKAPNAGRGGEDGCARYGIVQRDVM